MSAAARSGTPTLRAMIPPVVTALLLVAPLDAQQQREEIFPAELLRGREITFEHGGAKWRGELLAVSEDTVWIGTGRVTAYPLSEILEPSVRRHEWGMRRTMTWSLVVGSVAGAALAGACSTVDDTFCGPVFLATFGGWTLAGALIGLALDESSRRELEPRRELLRPYARFPQGLPEVYPRSRGR